MTQMYVINNDKMAGNFTRRLDIESLLYANMYLFRYHENVSKKLNA
jgi:hypothetical protein